MKIAKSYSHMNGEEYLSVRKPGVLAEIRQAIAHTNYLTVVNEEVSHQNSDPESRSFHNTLCKSFIEKGWRRSRCYYYGSRDDFQNVAGLSLHEQRRYLERAGIRNPIKSFMRLGFVKDRVAIEAPLYKSLNAWPAEHLKQLLFYSGNIIDVGVEILPVKAMTEDPKGGRMMSTGVAYYEGEVYNVLRHGRASPPVPLFIIGIAP